MCFYGYEGFEYRCYDNFQILLTDSRFTTVRASETNVPKCELLTQPGLGVGYVSFGGEPAVGKIQHSRKGILVPYGGGEHFFSDYFAYVNQTCLIWG